MQEVFSDLPGRVFDSEEVSAIVYEIPATDSSGSTPKLNGTDPVAPLQEARAAVRAQVEGLAVR